MIRYSSAEKGVWLMRLWFRKMAEGWLVGCGGGAAWDLVGEIHVGAVLWNRIVMTSMAAL